MVNCALCVKDMMMQTLVKRDRKKKEGQSPLWGGEMLCQNIVRKRIVIHGIGVEIVPIGLRVIMIRDRVSRHLGSWITNVEEKRKRVIVGNS